MITIQDEDSEEKDNCFSFIKEGSSNEETHESQLETLRKYSDSWTYISPSKSDAEVGSGSEEEIFKYE